MNKLPGNSIDYKAAIDSFDNLLMPRFTRGTCMLAEQKLSFMIDRDLFSSLKYCCRPPAPPCIGSGNYVSVGFNNAAIARSILTVIGASGMACSFEGLLSFRSLTFIWDASGDTGARIAGLGAGTSSPRAPRSGSAPSLRLRRDPSLRGSSLLLANALGGGRPGRSCP